MTPATVPTPRSKLSPKAIQHSDPVWFSVVPIALFISGGDQASSFASKSRNWMLHEIRLLTRPLKAELRKALEGLAGLDQATVNGKGDGNLRPSTRNKTILGVGEDPAKALGRWRLNPLVALAKTKQIAHRGING